LYFANYLNLPLLLRTILITAVFSAVKPYANDKNHPSLPTAMYAKCQKHAANKPTNQRYFRWANNTKTIKQEKETKKLSIPYDAPLPS